MVTAATREERVLRCHSSCSTQLHNYLDEAKRSNAIRYGLIRRYCRCNCARRLCTASSPLSPTSLTSGPLTQRRHSKNLKTDSTQTHIKRAQPNETTTATENHLSGLSIFGFGVLDAFLVARFISYLPLRLPSSLSTNLPACLE